MTLALKLDALDALPRTPASDVQKLGWRGVMKSVARHGQVLLISDAAGIAAAGDGITASLALPTGGGVFQPILYAVPMQYLAYHTAVAKGTDVDQPRNLAKSVTVE